jgi:hypothetical protein
MQGALGAVAGAAGAGGGGGGGGPEAAIAKMEQAFNRAIEMSARVTEITTEKKAELDASKQRPQG